MGYSPFLVFLFLKKKASPQKSSNVSVFLNVRGDIAQMSLCLILSIGKFPCLHSPMWEEGGDGSPSAIYLP